MNEIDAARIYKVLQKKLELPYSHKRATVFYFFYMKTERSTIG